MSRSFGGSAGRQVGAATAAVFQGKGNETSEFVPFFPLSPDPLFTLADCLIRSLAALAMAATPPGASPLPVGGFSES